MVKDTNIIKNMELENKDDKKILPTLKSKDVTLKIVKKNNFDSVNYNVSLSFRNIFKVEPRKNDLMVFYDKFTFDFLEKVSRFFDFSFFDENKVARIKEESFVNLDTTFYNFLLDENLDLSFENDVHNNFCLYLLCLQFLFLFFKKNRFYDSSIKVANSLFNRNNENRLLKFLSKTFSSKDNLNKITVDESADKIFNENFKDLYKSKLYNTIYSRLKEIKIKGISNVNESYFGSKEKAFNKLFLKKNDYTLRNINYEQFDSYYSLLADYDKNAYLEYSNLNPSKQINFYKGNEKKGNEKIIENVNSFLKTRKEEFELIEKIKGLDEILEYLRVNNVLLSNVEKSIENIAKKLEENNLPSFKQKYANDLKLPKFTQVNLIFSNDSLVDVPEVFKSLLRSMIFSCYFPTYSLKNEIKVDIDLKFTKEIKSNKVIYLPNTNSIYKKAAYYVLNRQCIANNVISYGLVYDSAFNYSMESYDIKDFFDTTNKYLKSEFESDNNINDNVKLFFTALEEIVNGDKNGINVNYDISQVLKKLSNSLQLKTILNRYEPDNNKCALIASYAFNHKDFSNFKNINDIFTLYEKNKDIFQIFDAKNFKFLKKLKGFSIGNLFKDDYCRNFVIEFHRNFNNKNYVGFDKDNNKNIDYFIPYNIVYNILLNYKVCLVHNVFEMRSDVLQNADSISLSCTCKQKIENVDKNVFNLKNHLTGILTKKRLLENYVFTPKNNSANNSRSLSEIKKALN